LLQNGAAITKAIALNLLREGLEGETNCRTNSIRRSA
jgi:hypothetical protein